MTVSVFTLQVGGGQRLVLYTAPPLKSKCKSETRADRVEKIRKRQCFFYRSMKISSDHDISLQGLKTHRKLIWIYQSNPILRFILLVHILTLRRHETCLKTNLWCEYKQYLAASLWFIQQGRFRRHGRDNPFDVETDKSIVSKYR